MTAHPERNPHISKQIDINKHNPLLDPLSEALEEYEVFPESRLNSYQLHILGELLDSLPGENIIPTMVNIHLAYPDLAKEKFSGTNPDQDAESFNQLIERKINFGLGDAPRDAGELVTFTFIKKALFSFLLRGPAAEWYENNITNATTWENVRTNFFTRFSDGRNNFWIPNGSGT